jgi:pentatricopeptide repeat protein
VRRGRGGCTTSYELGRASFNPVIKGLCKEGEVGTAMALFKMVAEVPRQHGTPGVSPNFEAYITLLEALVNKGVFGPALEVCKECLQNKWYMEREEWYVIRLQVRPCSSPHGPDPLSLNFWSVWSLASRIDAVVISVDFLIWTSRVNL